MIRTNATKERRQMFSVATVDTYLIFDVYLIPFTVGLPEGVEKNHLIKLNQQNGPPQNHHTTCTHTHIHTTHIYIHTSHYTYNLSQLTETPTKQTMIVAEEAVLTEALALLSPLQIFRRIPKSFDT